MQWCLEPLAVLSTISAREKKLVRKDSSFLVGVLEVRRSGLAVEERMEVVVEHAESKVLPSGQSPVFHKCTIVVPVS